MARIDHIAFWTQDIERLVAFYAKYFGVTAGAEYVNVAKGFRSCFVSFESGARIEFMQTTRLAPIQHSPGVERMGLTHLAVSVGSADKVDELTRQLRDDGYQVLDGPRHTGDGYYESVVLDPDGNRIEVTA